MDSWWRATQGTRRASSLSCPQHFITKMVGTIEALYHLHSRQAPLLTHKYLIAYAVGKLHCPPTMTHLFVIGYYLCHVRIHHYSSLAMGSSFANPSLTSDKLNMTSMLSCTIFFFLQDVIRTSNHPRPTSWNPWDKKLFINHNNTKHQEE